MQGKLIQTYRLIGLDRVLYLSPPAWPEGTFIQTRESEGDLRLAKAPIASKVALEEARAELGGIAARFRLAIERRTGCPLTMKLVDSEEPDFNPPGVVSGSSTVHVTATADMTTNPLAPPAAIEQLHEGAERWVRTLAEAHKLQRFADEQIKRYYLVIEELKDEFATTLLPEEVDLLDELRWLRNFVSHARCNGAEVCAFISQRLPSAIVATSPPAVRFDRTDIAQTNLVGNYVPKANRIASRLLAQAVAALT